MAPFSPTEEDLEKLFEDLPPIKCNLERLKNTIFAIMQMLAIYYIFYFASRSATMRTFVCD